MPRSSPHRPRASSSRLLIVAVASLIAAGCDSGRQGNDAANAAFSGDRFSGDRPLRIVATTGPVGDAVRRIAGDSAEVDVLMGPGVDPHLYKERLSDIRKLDAAHIVFYNGLHLEGTMADSLERLGQRKAVHAVAEVLHEAAPDQLRHPAEFDGMPDPHVWHDASLWAKCVVAIGNKLADFDPANAAGYRERAAAYRAEIETLHEELAEQLKTIPENRRVLVTAHDAFGYFCAAYGFEPVGLKGISTEDEVDLRRMQQVAELVVERKIPAVFVESAVAPRIVEALAEPCREAGHEVEIPKTPLYADALGSPESGADTYIGMMRANVKTIVEALNPAP